MTENVLNVPGWETTTLNTIKEVCETLDWLSRNNWKTRGQSRCYGNLYPTIDRKPTLDKLKNRKKKLEIESESIQRFQKIFPKHLASKDELEELKHDMNTLMVLQHYGVPTRLLDWSENPYIATYFSVHKHENLDSELWGFNNNKYEEQASKQWAKYTDFPKDKRTDVWRVLPFKKSKPTPDFIVCVFNYLTHHRIKSQAGFFTMTGCFGRDHSESLCTLFNRECDWYHRYIIRSDLKTELLALLKHDYTVEHATLFPDMAGAAEAVKHEILQKAKILISSNN